MKEALKIARSDEVISPSPQEERRESKRIQFYRGEFPDAKIEFGGRTYMGDVYDLSTNGIGILPREEIIGLDTSSKNILISFGQSKQVQAELKKITTVKFSGSVRMKLGFQLLSEHFEVADNQEIYDCSTNMPMAYCEDPIAFKKTMVFNVTHFSSTGFGLRTNFEDSGLYVGLCLDLRVMMPVRGEFSVIAEVVELTRKGDAVNVNCMMINPTEAFRNSISEFLLMTIKGLSVKKLRTSGFKVDDIEKAYLFTYANSKEQFERVLDLRLRAAQKAGRWVGETDIYKLSDSWDKHARHVICELNGQIVAAGRIVYNSGIPERSEHAGYNVEIPAWLWSEGFTEASRVCTDPDYRGSELFVLMLQHMAKIGTQSGYRYCLMNCEDSLVPIYRYALGVYSLGQKFHTPFMKDKALNLLCLDIRMLLLGINFAAMSWKLNVPLGMYMLQNGKITLTWRERLILPAFRLAHKLYAAFQIIKRDLRAAGLLKQPKREQRKS